MRLALDQAAEALSSGEVPVGCVFVKAGQVIAKSYNLTNQTKNATTHCEINCIRSMAREGIETRVGVTLYVTVEPCIMCAHALNLAAVERVVFGCENDKFGGNGSVLSLHLYPKGPNFSLTKGVLKD